MVGLTGISGDPYRDAHSRPDTDQSRFSIHHTLGTGPNQAAVGNHGHTNIIQYLAPSNTPKQMPLGFSQYYTDSTNWNDSGWPIATQGAVVLVFKSLDGARVRQEYHIVNNRSWVRMATSDTTWSAWSEISIISDTGWQPLAFTSGYTSYDTGSFKCEYRVRNSMLSIRGLVIKTDATNFVAGANVQVATLPTEARVSKHLYLSTDASALTGNNTRMYVASSGTINVQPEVACSWISLAMTTQLG